ncbi:hypothetical protein MIDIC_310024 [Alphaproteobacteria bacterium]
MLESHIKYVVYIQERRRMVTWQDIRKYNAAPVRKQFFIKKSEFGQGLGVDARKELVEVLPKLEEGSLQVISRGVQILWYEMLLRGKYFECGVYKCMVIDGAEYKLYVGGKRKSVITFDTQKPYVLSKEKECEECVTLYKVFQTYNCIGWAFGVSGWLNVPAINAIYNTKFKHSTELSKQKACVEAIDSYIKEILGPTYGNSESNCLNLMQSLKAVEKLSTPTKNNSIALYFNDTIDNAGFTHATRYVEGIGWTSKLGYEELVIHSLNELEGVYGQVLCYAEVKSGDAQMEIKQEL